MLVGQTLAICQSRVQTASSYQQYLGGIVEGDVNKYDGPIISELGNN